MQGARYIAQQIKPLHPPVGVKFGEMTHLMSDYSLIQPSKQWQTTHSHKQILRLCKIGVAIGCQGHNEVLLKDPL